ncbi:MAG: pimeloyl-ACP methyl ester carboxylesterase [Vicingaceae bacterium]|jgi:pimeloyl-ACP methyl ester carboxylesterase
MINKPVIYCIPGLGLDHRLFRKLSISGVELKFLDYIEPLDDEPVAAYAKRMADKIEDEVFSILGMSLGGILAIEISRLKKTEHLFLISTVKNKSEVPSIFKYMDLLPTKNKTASKLAIEASVAFKPYYDKSDAAGNKLFEAMIHAASHKMLAWGVKSISNWTYNEELTCPFYHLHGTADLIFPLKNIDKAESVKGATHYMVYNNAEEVSKRIEARIKILASK